MGKVKKKSRMGRPPLPKAQRKGTLIAMRLTPAFHKALCAEAKASGKCLTQYIRDVLEEKLNQERR